MMDEAPQYLEQLRMVWESAGKPAARRLAYQIEVSHTTVSDTLTGKSIPSLKVLARLTEALSRNQATRDAILDAYTEQFGDGVRTGPTGPRGQTQVAEAIREGLHEIAEAIRSLKD